MAPQLPDPVARVVPSAPTVTRAAEAFLVVFLVDAASTVTIGGQPVDLSTPAGRSSVAAALVSALILAARRALAARTLAAEGNGVG